MAFEWTVAAITVASVLYALWHLYTFSYLPQPFFYEPYDIYADWFNTAYWARDPGSYDVWATLYPPLSFIFLRIFGLDYCYITGRAYDPSSGLTARACDWLGLGSIWGFFFLNIILIYLVFCKTDRTTAIPRTICLGLGWPMLDGLERGNLFLVTFTCLILAFGPLLRSARLKWLMVGLAVNFKVYLIAAVIPLLLKRRWQWVECAVIAVVLVYAGSYALLGRGTPAEIFENLRSWALLETLSPLDMWFSTTYNSLLSLLKGDNVPFLTLIGSRNVDLLLWALPAILHFTQLLIVVAAAMVWLRPESVPVSRVVNLGLMLALITSESGGYSPAYFMLFVLMEPWRGFGRKWAIMACYLMAPALDLPIDEVAPVVRDTYFRGSTTIVTFYVTLWPIVRPLLIQTVAMAIAATTIYDVWRDIRLQGWSTRWRYRRDMPLLPWIKQPSPPGLPPQ